MSGHREMQGIEEAKPEKDVQARDMLDSFGAEVGDALDVVLTSRCRKMETEHPCDVRQLGPEAAETDFNRMPWDISSRNIRGGNALWQLMRRLMDTRDEIRDYEHETLGSVLKASEKDLTEAQSAFLEESLPLQKLFIYCAPCVCLIHTAMTISKNLSSPFIKVYVRPDDRLLSSCCDTADGAVGLKSILEEVRQWEAVAQEYDNSYLASCLDIVWLTRRLDHLDYDLPYDYQERQTYNPRVRVLVLGEAEYLSPLVQKAPGRMPMPMDIWQWRRDSNTSESRYKRTLFARFIESRHPVRGPVPDGLVSAQQVKRSPSGVSLASRCPGPASVEGGSGVKSWEEVGTEAEADGGYGQ